MRVRIPVTSKWPTIETLERRHILRVVKEQRGNLTRASIALGIDRRTLYRKLEKYRYRDPTEPVIVYDFGAL